MTIAVLKFFDNTSCFNFQRTGLTKLRRVLRAIRKHFPLPPDNVMAGNAIDRFLDNSEICEDKLSEVAGSEGFLDTMMKIMFPQNEPFNQQNSSVERYWFGVTIQLLDLSK